MRKEFLFVVVLLIVAMFVVSSCSSGEATTARRASAFVNANECTADDECEMDNAEVSGGLHANSMGIGNLDSGIPLVYLNEPGMNSGFVVNTLARFNDLSSFNGPVEMNDGLNIVDGLDVDTCKMDNAVIDGYLTAEGSSSFEGVVTFRDNVQFNGNVKLGNSGPPDSIGYVCIDNNNDLFRSETPCHELN